MIVIRETINGFTLHGFSRRDGVTFSNGSTVITVPTLEDAIAERRAAS